MKPGTGGEMKQKTAMQELLETVNRLYDTVPEKSKGFIGMVREHIEKKSLPTERKQIEEAYKDGQNNPDGYCEGNSTYFNSTYETP